MGSTAALAAMLALCSPTCCDGLELVLLVGWELLAACTQTWHGTTGVLLEGGGSLRIRRGSVLLQRKAPPPSPPTTIRSAVPLLIMSRQASSLPPATQAKVTSAVLPVATAVLHASTSTASDSTGMHQFTVVAEAPCRNTH